MVFPKRRESLIIPAPSLNAMRILLLVFFSILPVAGTDLVFEAFESDGFGEWQAKGKAFGLAPVSTSPDGLNGKVTGYSGQSYLTSSHAGDASVGTLTSPPFEIKLSHLAFHISGGTHPGKTAVQLLIDNKVVLEANGKNDLKMRQVVWPLKEFIGKTATLRIVDREIGGWGIINADHFVFSDNPKPFFPKPVYLKEQEVKEGLVSTDVIPGLTVPQGSKVTLFADHESHKLYSPTALTVDDKGRVFAAETHRFAFGVEDNRRHLYWLQDDLAAQTTDDRLALHKKWQEKHPLKKMTERSEKIRVLVDTDNDGVADQSKIFADSFNDILDGTAAGIMAFEGKIYFACIPKIWMLEDQDGDLVSDQRTALQDGFGVRVSFSGHDLNGFALGPDGRLYTTIGDRGFTITTREGKTYRYPNQGAILRFEPDGSGMEVVHTGLRNPKEIAFDQFGTGITVDNNSDQGDRARVVFMLEGADSGWRMGHQVLHSFHKTVGIPDRPINQWMAEKMWETKNEEQPGHIVPPMLNLTSGPSGLAYYPGTGFSLGCKDRFLICDYRGGAAASGIWSFTIAPDGAGFGVTHSEKFNWGVAATDLEWGYDGKLYVADFVKGWQSHSAGRIYSLSEQNPGPGLDPFLAENDFTTMAARKLAVLLGHEDQRIRLRAQLALVDRPEALPLFISATNQKLNPLERLHGIWGLGIMARKGNDTATRFLLQALRNNDPLVRAQVVQALGESTLKEATPLLPALSDGSRRVRGLAAVAVGRLRDPAALEDLIAMIAFNGNDDPVLRHCGVMGLLGSAKEDDLVQLADHESGAVRHAALLALRRLGSPKVIAFLGDQSLKITDDVIRAIHDTPIEEARPVLAALVEDPLLGSAERPISRMMVRRLIQSAFRISDAKNVTRLIKAAVNPRFPKEERLEAMRLLTLWENPPTVDPSTGRYSPLPPRKAEILKAALKENIDLLLGSDPEIFTQTMKLALAYELETDKLDSGSLTRLIRDDKIPGETRAAALDLFLRGNPANADDVLGEAARSESDLLSSRALELASKRNPASTVAALKGALKSESVPRRQKAWSIIATLPGEHAVPLIREGLADLREGKIDRRIQLDLILAAQSRNEPAIKAALADYQNALAADDPLAAWQPTFAGGDLQRGFKIFQTHPAAQCMRCHRHQPGHNEGGEAGPNLMGVALRHDARGLVESLILPHAQIADGFGVATIELKDGTSKSGTIAGQTEDHLDLRESPETVWRIKTSDLAKKPSPISAMPAIGTILTPREVRDVVAWLLSLTKENPEKASPYSVQELSLAGAKKMDEQTKTGETPPQPKNQPTPTVSEDIKIDPAVMELGKAQYALCMGCHGPDGAGLPNVGPPLANSEWVQGPIENLIGIQLRGLNGPITVNGQEYSFPAGMMAMGAGQSDENIAAVLTYIRNSFGNKASGVTSEMVKAYREANAKEIAKPMNFLKVKDLIDPKSVKSAAGADGGDTTTGTSVPVGKLPEIPSTGLGASGWGIFTTIVIVGLSLIAAMRMKKNVA